MSLLEVEGLSVSYRDLSGRDVRVVNQVQFQLEQGELLGIVGESGSGKSQTALALMGLLDHTAQVSGAVRYDGRELLGLPEADLRKVRGNRIAMIFQDPMTSLNPHMSIGKQLAEVLHCHRGSSQREAMAEAVRMLDAVRIPAAARRITQYPHQLSGGMRQRVMIAMALMCRPDVLIADEPTTALDVTIQAQILALLNELRAEFGLSIVMITHDLGVVAQICDQVMVMYAGQIMESNDSRSLLRTPGHPYTMGLLNSLPDLSAPADRTLRSIAGQPPNPAQLPSGCPFRPRCEFAIADCERFTAPAQPLGTAIRACTRERSELVHRSIA